MHNLVFDVVRGVSLGVLIVVGAGCSNEEAPADAGPAAQLPPLDEEPAETLRRLDDFTVLEHLGPMRVVLTRSRLRRLSIRGPGSQHENVEAVIEGETLSLRCRRGTPLNEQDPASDDPPPPALRCETLTVFVSTDELTEIRHFGTGTLASEGNIDAPTLMVRSFASGALELGLATERFQLIHTGTGTVHLDGRTEFAQVTQTSTIPVQGPWRAKRASVHITSSGDVELEVIESLSAYLTSSGSIRLRGTASVEKTELDTGRVLPLPFNTIQP